MKIAIAELRPNPFRHLERYPLDQEKIDGLVTSIKETGFWDNLLARKAKGGGFELAYGHHRLAALKKARYTEIDIPVRPLDDTKMAQIMALENQEEWGTNALIEQETVRAIVEGFAEGRIVLPKVKGQGQVRHAPSFIAPGPKTNSPASGGISYTAESLAKFTNKPAGRIEAILSALATLEKGLLKSEDLTNLTTHQAGAIATQVRRVVKETGKPELAKAIGRRLADQIRAKEGRSGRTGAKSTQAINTHTAKRATDEMMIAERRRITPPKEHPLAEVAVPKFAQKIALMFTPSDPNLAKVKDIIAAREHLHPKDLKMVKDALRALAKRINNQLEKLEA